jgi:hypothetical protein
MRVADQAREKVLLEKANNVSTYLGLARYIDWEVKK